MIIRINEVVKKALAENLPVVALESTIITHGLPYPQNIAIARKIEAAVKENGGVPATIAIMDGEIVVGLTSKEIETLAKRQDVIKVSRRDLSYVVGLKKWGATTVAATMIIAKKAGIKVFVTGGIGGVHRGAEQTFDISSDLEELGRTNITVVCAGPKAILDLPKTIEYLETKGVPVLGYKTDKMPLFYTISPTERVLYRVDEASDIAKVMMAQSALGLESGVLVVNPIPAAFALPYATVEKVINAAISEMHRLGIKGKEETPFLLAKISELTKAQSLIANEALVLNNAKLGAKIAKHLGGK